MSDTSDGIAELVYARQDLKRSNPVFWLERLARLLPWDGVANWSASRLRLTRLIREISRAGVGIPREAVERFVYEDWAEDEVFEVVVPPSARVVGLAVRDDHGLVVPLAAQLTPTWSVHSTLPFTAPHLQDAVSRLFTTLELRLDGQIPERLAFQVETELREPTYGRSMDLAGLLALIDAANSCASAVFHRACCVVESDAKGKLRPVDRVSEKLAAFKREMATGSLLVRAADCPDSAAYDRYFDQVWQVNHFRELGERLRQAGLLAAFLERVTLDQHHLRLSSERLRVLMNEQLRYSDALHLATRLTQCRIAAEVPSDIVLQLNESVSDLFRHTGRFTAAIRASRETMERLDSLGPASCYDQQCNAALNYAAALYDPHRFEEVCETLEPWVDRVTNDPRLVSAQRRIAVRNTLGRAQIALGRLGWESNFRHSLELQRQTDPASRARTSNYLIHGLLRAGNLVGAQEEITKSETSRHLDTMSGWMLTFLKADLARREDRVWSDPAMEEQAESSGGTGHPFAFYFQATARQTGRSTADAVTRFHRAREFFEAGLRDADQENILRFLSGCMGMAAVAWSNADRHGKDLIEELDGYVNQECATGLRAYYEVELRRLQVDDNESPKESRRESAEMLLARIPFF